MTAKPKAAFYWCASCGGCEEAVVDLAHDITYVADVYDIVFWPCVMDFKTNEVEAMEDASVEVSFINGAIRTEEHEYMAKLLRRKSHLVVAFGSCSSHGGVPALANLTTRDSIFNTAYLHSPTIDNPRHVVPQTTTTVDNHELKLPRFYSTVYKLDDIIDVDYYLPGCAPPPDMIAQTLRDMAEGTLPPKGSVLSSDKCLCTSCTRNETKPEDVVIKEIKRVIDIIIDPETCFLAQGVLCMGPATRDGCGAPCIGGNMPCTGCFGPTDSCEDQGGKMIAMLGGVIAPPAKPEA